MECLTNPGKMDHSDRVHFNVSCYWSESPGSSIMAQVPKPLSEGGLKSLSACPRPLPPPPPKLSFEEAGLFEPVICDFSGFGQSPLAGSLTPGLEGTTPEHWTGEENTPGLGALGNRCCQSGEARKRHSLVPHAFRKHGLQTSPPPSASPPTHHLPQPQNTLMACKFYFMIDRTLGSL